MRNGIGACSENAKYYAIHDGARPLITVEEIERVVEAAFDTGAATLGTSVKDTIKVVDGFNNIESTPIRSQLRAVQTPQVLSVICTALLLKMPAIIIINLQTIVR